MKNLLIILLISITSSAFASEIKVSGKAYDSKQCRYYWQSLADFNLSYLNDKLPWGSSVALMYGFHDRFHNQYWTSQDEIKMNSISSFTWATEISKKVVNQKGSFNYNYLEFVFKITLPNGKIIYDNGGLEPMGYYGVPVPYAQCHPGEFKPLEVKPLAQNDPEENPIVFWDDFI
jgi:hypothetical protein